MGGCNRCDGGSIRHTAGHGDTRSEKCPWCRIAELEAEMKRYADALGEERAKLAMVKEWLDANRRNYFDSRIYASDRSMSELDAIFSDTRKPLAVVDAWADNDELEEAFSPIQGSVMGLYSRDNGECTPVRVIVMPKEADNG
jgi:hypothetical protein